jgi:hypothetical protein
MTSDRYTRVVLTVIAGALVYLCLVLTPWPTARAQTALRPGDPTGPGEVVIVGWRLPKEARFPVQVVDSVPITGDVRVVGDVRVGGIVQTEQRRESLVRVTLAGWEERSNVNRIGNFRPLEPPAGSRLVGVPVSQLP